METESGNSYFIFNSDGYKIFCKEWKTKGTPRALVFISHGFAEHCLYYDTLASALVEIGCHVQAHDHVGHGRSEGPKVQIEDIDVYIRDLFQHTGLAKEEYPGVPFYYIGHSMGSAMGVIAALKKPTYFEGLLLQGIPIYATNKLVTPLVSKLCQVLGWMLPNLPLFPLDYRLPTRDVDIMRTRIDDPYSFHGFSKAGWCRAMLKAMEDIENNLEAIEIPLLLMHGENDKICSIEGSKVLYQKCSSTDKTLKVYPKAYHNLLDEPDGIKEQVLEDMILWLKDRINWHQQTT